MNAFWIAIDRADAEDCKLAALRSSGRNKSSKRD